MRHLALVAPADLTTFHSCVLLKFDEKAVVAALEAQQRSFLQASYTHPRSAPSDQVTACTYKYWVGMKGDKAASHVHKDIPYALRRLLVRCRLGCHELRIHTGRFAPKLPRSQRTCQVHAALSNTTAVEDMAHFLLECPAYSYIRTQFLDIFRRAWQTNTLAAGVRAVFQTKHQLLLAVCLQRMLAHRHAILSAQPSADDPTLHGFAIHAHTPIPDPIVDAY
jgi:hypothetical protein